MNHHQQLLVSLGLAELLHATLGPLADQLIREGHPWAPMLRRVLNEYTSERNSSLVQAHGTSVISEISHATYLASERVCSLTERAVDEERDFIRWRAEVVDGDLF